MEQTLLSATLFSLWLGILTSLSPCPMATNISALAYLSGTSPRLAMFYTLGRAISYVALATILLLGLTAVPSLSFFLQNFMNELLGPLLILAGGALLGLWSFPRVRLLRASLPVTPAATSISPLTPLTLGVLFALAFCPISAALFFGSLLPLALSQRSPVLLPVSYALGTALPVVVLTLGTTPLLKSLRRLEPRLRSLTGFVFVLAGIYLSLRYVFHVLN
jgi:hypothetical protein